MSEELLDLGVVVDQGHVQVGRAGSGDRPAVDAQELAVVDVGGDLHHADGVLRVVQHFSLGLPGDVGKAQRGRRDHHRGEEPQHAGVDQPLAEARNGARRQQDDADPHAEQRREGQAVVQPQEGDGHEAADHRARDGPERVGGVGGADAATDGGRTAGHDLADQREGRAHGERRRQDHREGLDEGEPERRAPVGVAEALPPRIEPVEQAAEDGDAQEAVDADPDLQPAEERQPVAPPVAEACAEQAAEGQPGEDGRQHGAEGIRRVADEEGERAGPDDLVGERGEPGQREAPEDAAHDPGS